MQKQYVFKRLVTCYYVAWGETPQEARKTIETAENPSTYLDNQEPVQKGPFEFLTCKS